MKNFLLGMLLFIFIYNCSDMNDLHQPYLDRGEKTYTEKVDSLIAFTGNNRAQLQWYLLSDLSIKKARIYWNKRNDSLEVNISVTPNVRDEYSVIIDNLEEDSYLFEVFTMDVSGNISVPVSRSIRVLGDVYKSNLDNRVISSHSQVNTNHEFTMSTNIPEDYVRSEFEYYDLNGVIQTAELYPDEDNNPDTKDKLILSDLEIDITKYISYRSVYLPNGNAIDEFFTEYAEYIIQ